MQSTKEKPSAYPKTASCSCGKLTVTVKEQPKFVHACSCVDCQRRSGSAFSYTAFFPEAAATISGQPQPWRNSSSDAGRWSETNFCPVCGVTVFMTLEALPGMICVPAGGFGDRDFPKPGKMYWSSSRHHWLDVPDGIEAVERQ